jgi:putative transcriptional regulator
MSVKAKGKAKGKAARPPNPIWERVAAELTELADALDAGGVEAAAEKFKVTRRAAGPPAVPAEWIASARRAVGLSQPAFAARLGVSAALVKGWEQGVRTPAPAVRLLLADIADRPDYWRPKLAG